MITRNEAIENAISHLEKAEWLVQDTYSNINIQAIAHESVSTQIIALSSLANAYINIAPHLPYK